MSHPIIHIGYPKTGTTWFQDFFYTKIDDTYFLSRQTISDLLIFRNTLNFDPNSVLNQINNISSGKKLLICEELLIGGLDISFGNGEFVYCVAQRLKTTFNDAEIVIFIRNQHSILESAFGHYVKSGGTYSIDKYLGFSGRLKHNFQNYHFFNPDFFKYDTIIEYYQSLFGRDNVHIYLYEDFTANPEQFIESFCSAHKLNKPSNLNYSERLNPRLSSFSVKLLRFLNHFTQRNTPFKSYLFRWDSIYPWLISLTDRIDRFGIIGSRKFSFNKSIHYWIHNYYSESNRNLIAIIGEEKLRKYNYPL